MDLRQYSFNAARLAGGFGLLLTIACDDDGSSSAGTSAQEERAHESDGEHSEAAAAHSQAGLSTDAGGSAGKAVSGAAGQRANGGPGTAGRASSGAHADAGSARASAAGSGDRSARAHTTPHDEADAGAVEIMGVTIRFKAKVGEKDFACGASYDTQGSKATTVTPQDMRLFIQDLALIDANGKHVPVDMDVRAPWQNEHVALLDFEDASGSCIGNPELNSEISGTVKQGTYRGLSFANGVPDDLNHADPVTLPDPLKSSASLSWGWLTGFRFAAIELVKSDRVLFGSGGFHTGSMACTGNPAAGGVTCSKPNRNLVVLDDFDPAKNSVVIDLAQLFASTDMSTESACHSSEASLCGPMFDAWGINFADGKPKEGQRVFKKE